METDVEVTEDRTGDPLLRKPRTSQLSYACKCWFLRTGKNLLEQSREPTNSTHIWRRIRESILGHTGGRRVLSPPLPEKNLSVQSREPANSTHMTPSLRIKPGQHWWEVSALNTVPPLHPAKVKTGMRNF